MPRSSDCNHYRNIRLWFIDIPIRVVLAISIGLIAFVIAGIIAALTPNSGHVAGHVASEIVHKFEDAKLYYCRDCHRLFISE